MELKIVKNLVFKAEEMFSRYHRYIICRNQFKRYLKLRGFQNKKAEGEELYINKWKKITKRVEPYSYRFFSHYCGHTANIIPEDIGFSYIEKKLNPIKHQATFSDKNLFPIIVGKENLPRTIVCRINGSNLLDEGYMLATESLDYYIPQDIKYFILKPTIATGSGKGILKFQRNGSSLVNVKDNSILNKQKLMEYGNDFCLQEAVEQHEFMNHLCATSVNTLRLCVYKSVVDEKPKVTSAIIRVGHDGSYVDNAHAGGVFAGIDVDTGKIGNRVFNQYGESYDKWNNVDYESEILMIPNWNLILKFAESIAHKVIFHRLFALDIALNSKGKPVLIEYNIGQGFSYWLYMYTGQEVFGKYTDEIISYCIKDNNKKRCFV